VTRLIRELEEVSRVNPVPPNAVAGERTSGHARALCDEIVRSSPAVDALPTRRVWRRFAIVFAAIAILGAGTAVASRLLSERDVERFLPQGALVFVGTDPRCRAVEPGIAYRCQLARTPRTMSVTGADGRPAFKGSKFGTVDDEDRVNGGCIALNDPGTEWACFLGERAVAENILDAGVLGQKQTGPAGG
jgi:hypothetical protein